MSTHEQGAMKRDAHSVAEKLAGRLVVDPATGCHNWTGAKNLNGYGRFRPGDGRGLLLPHRVAYELALGPIPPGFVIDHLCRNPACCNADHLEAITQVENVRRGNSGLRQRLRTHCPLGHAYDPDNTYRSASGHRYCRACIRARGPKAGEARIRDNARRRASHAQAVLDRGGIPRKKRVAMSGGTASPKSESPSATEIARALGAPG